MPFEDQSDTVDELTIHVVDDDETFREAVSWFLRGIGFTVENYANATSFSRAFNPSQPGLIILDIQMPGISGMDLLEVLTHEENHVPIIIYSGEATLHDGIVAMKRGVFEFLTKPFNSDQLSLAVSKAATAALERFSAHQAAGQLNGLLSALTPREREVYDFMRRGFTNKMIANTLEVCDRTVEYHRKNMLAKMGVTNLAGLIALTETS